MNHQDPFRSPEYFGDTNRKTRQGTGCIWVVSGAVSLLVSTAFMTFLMIAVIPEMVEDYDEQNLVLPTQLRIAIVFMDFLMRFWLIAMLVLVVAYVAMEIFLPSQNKNKARAYFGAAIILVAVLAFAWTYWVTAANAI